MIYLPGIHLFVGLLITSFATLSFSSTRTKGIDKTEKFYNVVFKIQIKSINKIKVNVWRTCKLKIKSNHNSKSNLSNQNPNIAKKHFFSCILKSDLRCMSKHLAFMYHRNTELRYWNLFNILFVLSLIFFGIWWCTFLLWSRELTIII